MPAGLSIANKRPHEQQLCVRPANLLRLLFQSCYSFERSGAGLARSFLNHSMASIRPEIRRQLITMVLDFTVVVSVRLESLDTGEGFVLGKLKLLHGQTASEVDFLHVVR